MNEKTTGILMIVLGIVLAILYLALPNLIIYLYWLAAIVIVLYGVYLFQKG